LTRLYTALKAHAVDAEPVDWNNPLAARFREVMNDDFNTPEAVALLFELAGEVNRGGSRDAVALLKSLAALLGLLERDATEYLQGKANSPEGDIRVSAKMTGELAAGLTEARIDELIGARVAARKAKNFAESDRIRKELLDAGIVLEDGPKGTLWRRG
jgi:cysteinyl-tRNA synthetase